MRGAEEGLSVVVGGWGAQQERPVWRHRFEIRRDTGEPMIEGNTIRLTRALPSVAAHHF